MNFQKKGHMFWGLILAGAIALILWQLGKWNMTVLIGLIGLAVLGFLFPPAAIAVGLLILAYLLIANGAVLFHKWFAYIGKKGATKS